MALARGRALFAILALVCLFGGTATAGERVKAVIELFTSQGCSSCPPADRHLADIADRTDLIALTLPVDYWDYLGWKDTLADPIHAKRQKAYSHVRGDRQVYTPQMVVNGVAHAIGSDRAAVERAVIETRARAGVLVLPVTISASGDRLAVTIPAGDNPHAGPQAPAAVLLLGVSSEASVTIARGENRGQALVYRNVVRSHTVLGEWTGTEQTFSLSRIDRLAPGVERAVVLVQAGTMRRPGALIGAAMVRFP